jgi:hypothetical protein
VLNHVQIDHYDNISSPLTKWNGCYRKLFSTKHPINKLAQQSVQRLLDNNTSALTKKAAIVIDQNGSQNGLRNFGHNAPCGLCKTTPFSFTFFF